MPTINTPTEVQPFFSLKTNLDGAFFTLRFEWNMRSGWYLGLLDSVGNTIFSPRKLVTGTDLLRSITDARRPPGKLALIDVSSLDREPGYASIGTTHALVYVSLEEIAELTA